MKFILLKVFFCLLIISCNKKNTEAVCDPTNEFKAGFKVGYQFLDGSFIPSDTITNFSVFIEADTTYDSYEWKIENDTRIFTSKKVRFVFPESDLGKTFTVRLIARGKKNQCNSSDNGIDTVSKSFRLLFSKEADENDYIDNQYLPAYLINLPIFGRWEGAFENDPMSVFTVLINNNGQAPIGGTERFYGFRVYNLPQGCSVKQQSGVANCEIITDSIQKYYGYQIEETNYNGFYIARQGFLGCCPILEMLGNVDTRKNTIKIKCTFYNNGIKEVKIFNGKKI